MNVSGVFERPVEFERPTRRLGGLRVSAQSQFELRNGGMGFSTSRVDPESAPVLRQRLGVAVLLTESLAQRPVAGRVVWMNSDSLRPRFRGAIERPQRCIDTAERLEQRVLAREWMEIQCR